MSKLPSLPKATDARFSQALHQTILQITGQLLAEGDRPAPIKLTNRDLPYYRPSFENSWVDFDTDNQVRVSKIDGFVVMTGGAKSGTTAATVFTLPNKYIPHRRVYYPNFDAAATQRWLITTHSEANPGQVRHVAGSNAFLPLNVVYWAGYGDDDYGMRSDLDTLRVQVNRLIEMLGVPNG